MRACLLFALLFLLAACAPQPTALLPTATSTPAPTHTPTLTPSPTLTPTPTPLPHPAAFDEAFARGLIRYDAASGQWLVSVVQTADGGRQTADFTLLPDSFATHDDLRLKNPLAPYTARAISPLPAGEGPGVREVTLLWNAEKAEFRLAYEIPNVQQLLESGMSVEEIESLLPIVSPEDFTDGTVIQSVLLAMERDGYQPFSQQAAENYQRLLERNYGPRLHFEITAFDGTHVQGDPLKTASLILANPNWQEVGDSLRQNGLYPQIMAPYFLRVKIGDENYLVASFPTLNPADPKNVSTDDYVILFGIPIQQARNSSKKIFWQRSLTLEDITTKQNFFIFRTYLFSQRQDGAPLDPNSPNLVESLLAQLLSIEGNDASKLGQNPGYLNLQVNIEYNMKDLPELKIIETQSISRPLPPQLQQMIFLFEVGVAQ